MDWKTNPTLLAEQLLIFLGKNQEASIDMLDVKARNYGINGYTLDAALELLHKLPQVKKTVKRGSLYYSLQAVPMKKPVTAFSHVQWVSEHYPRPGENGVPSFVMPFPEMVVDIFMKQDERYVAKKSYEYSL